MKFFSFVGLLMLMSCATPVKQKPVERVDRKAAETPVVAEERSWATQRNSFFTAIGSRINTIDSEIQKMENTPAQGTLARKNLAYQSISETRDLLEEVRVGLAKLRKVSEKDWGLKKEDFIASMNDLEAKYELVKKFYTEQ